MKDNNIHMIYDLLKGNYPKENKLQLLYQLERGNSLDFYQAMQLLNRNLSELSRPEIDEMITFGNIHIRRLYFPTASTVHEGHRHDYDHVSYLLKGKVIVETDHNSSKEYSAGAMIVIRKNVYHKIIALEDDTTWLCISTNEDFNERYLDDMFTIEQDPLRTM